MPSEALTEYAAVWRDPHPTLDAVLRGIARLAIRDRALSAYTEDKLYDALRAREVLGSTGVGGGIAIPHCHLAGLSHFVAGVVTVPEGVAFKACDGKPVRLLMFIFAPAERRSEHVSMLASASRVLADPTAAAALLACRTDPELLACLKERWTPPRAAAANLAMGLLTVYVQREELMEPLLEMLSETVSGEISVIEGRSARTYLHRLPLFSGFWTDDDRGFLRIISALVVSTTCNDVARRVMLIAGDGHCPGVLVTVQDIRFAAGRLEF